MLKALPLKGVRGLTWCWMCGDGRWMTVNSMTDKHIINVIRIKRSYGESDHPGSELGFFLEVARGRGILSRVSTAQVTASK